MIEFKQIGELAEYLFAKGLGSWKAQHVKPNSWAVRPVRARSDDDYDYDKKIERFGKALVGTNAFATSKLPSELRRGTE